MRRVRTSLYACSIHVSTPWKVDQVRFGLGFVIMTYWVLFLSRVNHDQGNVCLQMHLTVREDEKERDRERDSE